MSDNIILFPETKARIDAEDTRPMLEKRKEAISKLPHYRGEVASKNSIRQLPDVEPGQIFWVDMDNRAYLVAQKDKHKMTIKALDETATLSTGMTIYEMNKTLVSKEPVFDWDNEEKIKELKKRFEVFFNEDTDNIYYLLYGRDIHYVSLIKVNIRPEESKWIPEDWADIFEPLKAIGDLISVDFNTSDDEVSAEVWIRTPDSKAELLYLMPFDRGVIYI